MEDLAQQLKIDVDRRTTRGRSCPRCGGKIIPSHRAVYQSAGDPNDVFPSWQCERCGYEELIARPVKAATKHGATGDKAAPEKRPSAVSASSSVGAVSAPQAGVAARAVPALKDRKGRALPPDVNRMMAEMTRGGETKE
jgi:ribosomal protein S27AE